jgi:hypothetical protein
VTDREERVMDLIAAVELQVGDRFALADRPDQSWTTAHRPTITAGVTKVVCAEGEVVFRGEPGTHLVLLAREDETEVAYAAEVSRRRQAARAALTGRVAA